MTEESSSKNRYRSKGPQHKRGGNIWLGLVIIGVGVFFLLRQMGIVIDIDMKMYWPCILILVGLFKVILPSSTRSESSTGFVLVMMGIVIQLHTLHIFRLDWNYIWPVLIIVAGFKILFSKSAPKPKKKSKSENSQGISHVESTDSWMHGIVLLGGKDTQINSQTFQGGEIKSILGSYEIDLTQAEMENGQATIAAIAIMGSVELSVPKHWRIRAEVTPIMGSFEDQRRNPNTDPNAPELVIRGEAIMGSIEVRD